MIFGSIFDKLARKCEDIDLYLLSGDTHQDQPFKYKAPTVAPFSLKKLGFALGIVIVCTLVDWLLLYFGLSSVNYMENGARGEIA